MAAAITRGSRLHLGRALSWSESTLAVERHKAAAVARLLLQQRRAAQHEPTTRIGITGPPGAGKSSLIEALGQVYARDPQNKVAVLCIDPSSALTGGSIMG